MDLDDYLPPTSAAKRSVHDRDAIFPMVTRARAWEPTPPPLARVEPIVTRSSAKKAKQLDSRRKDEEMLDEDMMQTPTAKAPNPKFSSVAVEPNAKKTPKVREDGTTYRWTEEEHSRFLEALALHGFDLTKIAQHIETRDSNQCKSHAQKYFDKPENAAAKEALVKKCTKKKVADKRENAAAKKALVKKRTKKKVAAVAAAPSLSAPVSSSSSSPIVAAVNPPTLLDFDRHDNAWVGALPKTFSVGMIVGRTASGKTKAVEQLITAGVIQREIFEDGSFRDRGSKSSGGVGGGGGGVGGGSSSSSSSDSDSEVSLWPIDRAIVSAIAEQHGGTDEAINRLNSCGMNTAPNWLKAFRALSNGQQARASVAMNLRSGTAIHHFSATVGEREARSFASGVARTVRREELQNVVLTVARSDSQRFSRRSMWEISPNDDDGGAGISSWAGTDWVYLVETGELFIDASGRQPIDKKPRCTLSFDETKTDDQFVTEMTAKAKRDFLSAMTATTTETTTATMADPVAEAEAVTTPEELLDDTPMILESTVVEDKPFQDVAALFDVRTSGKSKFVVPKVQPKNDDWKIMLLQGASGTGKSTILAKLCGNQPVQKQKAISPVAVATTFEVRLSKPLGLELTDEDEGIVSVAKILQDDNMGSALAYNNQVVDSLHDIRRGDQVQSINGSDVVGESIDTISDMLLNATTEKVTIIFRSSDAETLLRSLGGERLLSAASTRPSEMLSKGEQHLCQIARAILYATSSSPPSPMEQNVIPIDEFTSGLDRKSARQAAIALASTAKHFKHGRKIVVAAVHFDLPHDLRPDLTFDTNSQKFVCFPRGSKTHSGVTTSTQDPTAFFFKPQTNIVVRRTHKVGESRVHTTELWQSTFKMHHYLSQDLCRSATCFAARRADSTEVDGAVGFAAVLPQPGKKKVGDPRTIWRESRLVVLPECQGLSIGPQLSDLVGDWHVRSGKRFTSKTRHPRFGAYRNKSDSWEPMALNMKPDYSFSTHVSPLVI